MPLNQDRGSGVVRVAEVNNGSRVLHETPLASRYNKRQAPSNVTAEAYLAARNNFGPVYVHSELITRLQNVSNLVKHPPRFRDSVDILA